MKGSGIPVPVDRRYFEDYVPGSIVEAGSVMLGEADILGFARRFDPQYIHTDARAAADGPFGGLIASGWHTAVVMMRHLVDSYWSHTASMASPGIRVLEATPSRSKPDRGMIRSFVEVLNQTGEVVVSMIAMNILRRRMP